MNGHWLKKTETMRPMETTPSTALETRPARRCSAIWDNLSDLPLIMQVMLAMLASVISIVLGYLVFNFAINEITKSVSINEITKSIDASSSAGAPPSHIGRSYVVGNAFWNRGIYADKNLSYMSSFPGSIMLEYSKSMRKSFDISVLADIIERRRNNTTKKHGTVIHLRMGDDIVEDSCWEQQCIFNNGGQNPLSRPAFENLTIPSFDSVFLIGSYNGGGWHSVETKSIAYAMQVEHYFLSRDVVVKSHFTAFTSDDYKYVDADIVDATHTSKFVCSGGTFSFTLAAVVLYNGGKIYNCKYRIFDSQKKVFLGEWPDFAPYFQ